MGKKINLVTFCILFSSPNKADIEIKTFLEIICTGALEHRTPGWNLYRRFTDKAADDCNGVSVWCWQSQHYNCVPSFSSPSAASPSTGHLGLNFQTPVQLLPGHQNKWLGLQELWLCQLLGHAESQSEGIAMGRIGHFLQLLDLMLPCLSVLVFNGSVANAPHWTAESP